MPSISFFGGDDVNQVLPAGSGEFDTLGFFGPGGFGFSVQVASFQDNSFVTNDDGSSASGQVPNLKFASTTGAFVAGETSATILSAPASGSIQMAESTLHLVFDSTDIGATQTQNASFRAFDGSNINNAPSGVTIQAFELKGDPSGLSLPADFNTDGDSSWTNIFGSGSVLSVDDQLFPSGVHDYYIGISGRPNSIGQKQFGYYFELEFL